jgi:hypothetical protein
MDAALRKHDFMKLEPNEIYQEATRRGLRLIPRGDKLEVNPKSRLTPEFTDVLREHKEELLAFLEVCNHRSPLDCAPWLHVAKQALAGEFDGADNSTIQRLAVGLRGIGHPLCQCAIERLYRQPHDRNNDKP